MVRRAGWSLMALVLVCLTASAQTPPPPGAQPPGGGRGGPQGPPVVSPEVNRDRTITVRVYAPKATEIRITGEILNGAQPVTMTKGEDGIWSATLGPLPPDIYTYAFNIDGVSTPDPRNPG